MVRACRLLLTLLMLWTATPAFAQAPPNPFPIEGRLVRFGYDLTYPTIPGDLIGIGGDPVSAQNNGVIVALPSRNVTLNCDAQVYQAEVWATTQQAWVPTVWPVAQTAYYPTDNFAHTWVPCAAGTPAVTLAPLGVLRCHGYDGTLSVPGDLQPGSSNGVLFSVYIEQAHIITAAKVYHGYVRLGSYGLREAVYAVGMCDFDPL